MLWLHSNCSFDVFGSTWIEEIHLRFFGNGDPTLFPSPKPAWGYKRMLLHFDAIDHLGLAKVCLIRIGLSWHLQVLSLIFFLFLRKDGLQELKVTTVQLKVDQFINQLANLFAIAFQELLLLEWFHVWETKLLKIWQHLDDGLVQLSLEVFKIDEDSLLLTLKAIDNELTPKSQINKSKP